MPRIEPVPEDIDDQVLNPIFDRFRAAGHDVPLLYRTLGRAPAMLGAWTAMAWPLRTQATTDRGLREIIIMRVALLTGAAFEWQAHWPAAIGNGVGENQLGALGAWADAEDFSTSERAVLRCVDEIIGDGQASSGAIDELMTCFDPGECIELVLTAAFYSCVSSTLLSLGIEADSQDPVMAVYDRQRSGLG